MYAITLWRPWPWAIIHGKDIENRPWRPPDKLIGKEIAIHAGSKWDDHGAAWIDSVFGDLGVSPPRSRRAFTGVVAIARIAGVVTRSDSPWFVGPCGWLLDDVREIEQPIQCRGFQRLWRLKEPELAELVAADPLGRVSMSSQLSLHAGGR